MAPFPGLTKPKLPVNVEEDVAQYELNDEKRAALKAAEEAAAAQQRRNLYQREFGPGKGGRRTRSKGRKSRGRKTRGKSRRRK